MKKIISGVLAFAIFMGVISNPVSAYIQEEQNKINIENSINKDSDLITNDKYGIEDINLYNLLADESGEVSKVELAKLKELTITNESNVSTLKGLDVCTNLEKLIIESQALNSLDGIESLEFLKELVVDQGDASNVLSFSNISKLKSIEKVTLVDIDSKRLDVLFGNEHIEEINITLNNYSIDQSLNIANRLKESNSNLTKLSINNIEFMNQNLENKKLIGESQQNNYSNLDINGDGLIDVLDLSLVAARYNTTKESANWDVKRDVNNDGIVDIFDLVLVSKAFGDTSSSEIEAKLKSFTTSLPSGQAINQPITLSATSDLDKDVLYEFSVIGNYDSTWTTLKSYNSSNSVKWTPTKTGNYTLRVKAKHINSKVEYDDLSEIQFEVVGNIKSSKLYVSNYGRIDLNTKEVPLIAITYEDDNVVYKVPDELKQENNVIAINSDKSITAMKTGKGKLIAKYKGQEYSQDITVTDNKALLDKYNNMTTEPLKDSVIDVEVKAQSITEGIKLSWMYLPIITKYEIYRKDSVSDFVKIAELDGRLAPEEYIDKEVEAKKEYVYRIDVTTTDNVTQQLNEIKITSENMVVPTSNYVQAISGENTVINPESLRELGTNELKRYIKKVQKEPLDEVVAEMCRRVVPDAFNYKNVFITINEVTKGIVVEYTNDNLVGMVNEKKYLFFGKDKNQIEPERKFSLIQNCSLTVTYPRYKDLLAIDENGNVVSYDYNEDYSEIIGISPGVDASVFVYKYTTPDGEVIYPDDLTLEEDDDGEIITKSSLNISAKAGTSLTKGLVGLDPEDCQFKEGDETVVFATNGSPYLARVYKIQERDAMGKVKLYAIPYDLSEFYVDNKGPGDAKALLSLLLDFTPIFSDFKDLYELLDGKDMITGEELNRTLMLVVLLTPAVLDAPLKALAKKYAKSGPEFAEALKRIGKNTKDLVTEAFMKIKNKLKGNSDEVWEYVTETKDMGNYINCKTTDNISVDIPKGELTDVEEMVLLEGCFVGSTIVETNMGPKRIDEIKIGDLVLAKNVLSGEVDYRQVKKVHVKTISNLYNLVVSGEIIETTTSHLFMKYDGEWVEAEKLEIGDQIVTSNGEVKVVQGFEGKVYNNSVKVYDLTVEEFSTYFVGKDKLLVHNTSCSMNGFIKYKLGFDKHLVEVVDVVWKNGKGIVGGHNLDNFENVFKSNGWDLDEYIISKKSHSSIEGIYEVEYRLPAKDSAQNYIEGQYKKIGTPKTVYDPQIISDEKIVQLGKEAMENGFTNGRTIIGEASNGLTFVGYVDEVTNEITNFYPVLK